MVTNTENNVTRLNTANNILYSAYAYVSKAVQEKYDFSASFGPEYSIYQSSLQPIYNGNGNGFLAECSIKLYLPKRFEFSSDVNYKYAAETKALPVAFKRTIWNASISKAFLKERNLKITGAVNDLLNQNQGLIRRADGSIISEERYSTIKRYFMLAVSYDFSNMHGGVKE